MAHSPNQLSLALVPRLLNQKFLSVTSEIVFLLLGVALVSALSQLAIPLAWTPVPLTGQTFGVALLALMWGSRRAFAVMASYLSAAALGAPILAGGVSFLTLGATSGYLFGMAIAAYVVGSLADRGWTKSWPKAFAASLFGSVIVFSLGLFVLSFFVPSETLLVAGLLPFLPGDLLKNLMASFIASRMSDLAGD